MQKEIKMQLVEEFNKGKILYNLDEEIIEQEKAELFMDTYHDVIFNGEIDSRYSSVYAISDFKEYFIVKLIADDNHFDWIIAKFIK